MIQFDLLADAVSLVQQGRLNAAKAQWAKLPTPFQLAVLQFVTNSFGIIEPLNCEVTMKSNKFGQFILSDKLVAEWKEHVPKLVS